MHPTRAALLTLFSGVLEFNNMFASYKGEGTGAVRHMFSHHILKPERTPIEANVWGTPKSSGSFSNLFRSRLLRAIEYRRAPTEVNGTATARGRDVLTAFHRARSKTRWPDRRPVFPSARSTCHAAIPPPPDCPTEASTWSSPIRPSSITSTTRNWRTSSTPGGN